MEGERPVTSDPGRTASSITYGLTCTDCGFESTVRGSVYEALYLAKAHRNAHGEPGHEHFVDFRLEGLA